MMESSNSGSFQSSSGGGGAAAADNDHEYDDSTNCTQSQSHSISSASAAANNFFINNNNNNNNNPTNNNSFNHHQLLQQASYNNNTTTTFYNHLHPPVQVQPTSLLSSSSSIQDPTWIQTSIPTTFTHQNPITTTTTTTKTHQIGVVKNPKKRTRASRRAPTTVLTTDTTNFRQMVQEFTGIPTAPFTRLFRPKIQSQSPFLNNNNNNNNNIVTESSTSNNINTTAASNYQYLSPCTTFQKQPSSTFLDLQQNPPMFSFQSLILQNSRRSWGEDQETNFQNIAGSKLNSALEMNASTADQLQLQLQGNQGSWISPNSN